MKVERVMRTSVFTCAPDETLADAAQVMWEKDCGFVPVVDRSTGRLVGVVTDRDACMAAYTQGKPLSGISVRSAMATHVHTCAPDDDLKHAERLMAEHQVRRLPVVDDGHGLVGVVSLNDLAIEALQEKANGARELVARTLGRICRHRALSEA